MFVQIFESVESKPVDLLAANDTDGDRDILETLFPLLGGDDDFLDGSLFGRDGLLARDHQERCEQRTDERVLDSVRRRLTP